MADTDDSDLLRFVVNLVTYPPIAEAYAPEALLTQYLSTAVRARIVGEGENGGNYSVLYLAIEFL